MAVWKSKADVPELNMVGLFLAISVTCLSGCALDQRQPTSHEPPGVKVHTRDYPGIVPLQVLEASEKIFQLAYGKEVIINRGFSTLEVKRPNKSLGFKSFWELWKTETREKEGTTYVTVSAELDQDGSKVSPRGLGTYHLFFARLDFMLGASKNWMTCNQYEARLTRDLTWGQDNRFLCSKAKDKVPKGPMKLTSG